MQMRRLGRSELEIPPLVLGGNVFGWTADRSVSFRILDAAFERGLVAIDTADMYSTWVEGHSGGESEAIIGEWMAERGNRDRLVIMTKVGMKMGDGGQGLSRDRILEAAEASLGRLRTDRIDLYQAHIDDASTPLEETLGAFGTLVASGKVRAIGASNHSAARLREALETSRAHGLPRYEVLQPEYNLVERVGFETELAPLVQAEGIGTIPYYALASGFLTGKYRRADADAAAASPRGGKARAYLAGRGEAVLDALDRVAQRHDANPTRIALAWLIARPGVTAPIASASRPEQVEDLARATEIALDANDIAELDRASGSA